MAKYRSPDTWSKEELQAAIKERWERWKRLATQGGQDPFSPDGTNMNLVRNHIIYYYNFLDQRIAEGEQLSLFESVGSFERNIPPLVPDNYMCPTGKYAHRLDGKEVFYPNGFVYTY